jgi:hypothetical protein
MSNKKEIKEGQCGLCAHFGAHHENAKLVEIRKKHVADSELLEECDFPAHAAFHLRVNAMSGCSAFEPAMARR